MATLVLTAVGGAIGGPVGAAIGGLLGQTVDRRVLAPKGRQGPRLTELAVQTSSYGTAIPRLFGRMRVAGCVFWSTDLIETRRKQRGGKGQPSTTTYSYAASFAVALSARPIVGVGRIWAEGKLLRGAAGDFKTETGFRLYRGGEDQSPDPLIASAEGLGATPAHRGIAYAMFEDFQLGEYGNRIPSLTFEVIADAAPVPIGTIAHDLGTAGAGPATTIEGFSAYGDSIRAVLETLAAPSGAWFEAVGDAIAMRDSADGVTAIEDAGVDGAAGARAIAPIETVPKALAVSHYDPARDYHAGVQSVTRPGTGRREERIDLPAVIGASQARGIAAAMLARAERARVRRTVRLDARSLGIAPGAAVAIAGETGTWRVVRAEIEAMAVILTLQPLAPAARPAPADAGRPASAADLVAGATLLSAFEMPALDDAGATVPRLTIAAAGTAPGWRRAALLLSDDDGASWQEIGSTAAPATVGTLGAALSRSPATLIDRDNAIELTLAHDEMVLFDADTAAIDAGANLAWIGGELIQFARARQIGPAAWRLTDLRRGRRGTPPQAHAAGARVVLLESDAALGVPVPISAIGRRLMVMAKGVGDAAPVVSETIVRGVSVAPPSPVRLAARRRSDGAVELTWRRRSRNGWAWRDGADTPLGEETERYRVTIETASGRRDVIVTTPATLLDTEDVAGGARVGVAQLGTHAVSATCEIEIGGVMP